MAKIDKVQEVAVELIKPYERNAKMHSPDQVDKIANSINEFGFISPCLIDKDYNLIAGHGRLMAVKKLGYKTIPCLFIEGLSEEQRKAYILADNKLTELGDWDISIVCEELKELEVGGFDISLTGFDIELEDEEPTEVVEDDYTEDVEPICKRGDIWQLGRHRLMCGDSTDVNVIEKAYGWGKG